MVYSSFNKSINVTKQIIKSIDQQDFTCPIAHLGNSSIGNHCRHIIELIQCMLEGYERGEVNYAARKRDKILENDKEIAVETLNWLINNIGLSDKSLTLVDEYEPTNSIFTSYYRELVYNSEHTIHHLALIKVALIDLNLAWRVDEDFGMAYATIKYKEHEALSQSI